ncbi:MAG: hypothetical protein IPJ65_24820 [Archangiaceae bacterium]|nr:hypothetical protein [Archangiaceae bacterium]
MTSPLSRTRKAAGLRQVDAPAVSPAPPTVSPRSEPRDVGADVYLDGSALVPRTGPSPTPAKKLDAGKRCLELLRGERGGLSFGWSVSGGVDAAGSLLNYYPSLELAKALLQQVPEAFDGVQEFVTGVSVPDDLAKARDVAILDRAGPSAEAMAPIGKLDRTADGGYQNLWNSWQNGDAAGLEVNDDTVEAFFGPWSFPPQAGQHFQHALNGNALQVLRLATRGKELNCNVIVQQHELQQLLDHASFPKTEAAAKVVRRAAQAFGLDLRQLRLQGVPLDQAQRPSHLGTQGPRPGRELGKNTRFAQDNDSGAFWREWQQSNLECTQVDDPSLQRMWTQWGMGTQVENWFNYGTPEFKVAALHFFARTKELGLGVVSNSPQHLFNQLPATSEAAVAAHRFARAFGLTESSFSVGGQLLSSLPDRAGGRPPRAAVKPLLVGHRLAETRLTADELQARVNACDPEVFEVDDETVKLLAQTWGVSTCYQLGHRTPDQRWHQGLLQMLARSCDLGVDTLSQEFQRYVQVIPAACLQNEDFCRLLAGVTRRSPFSPDQLVGSNGVVLSQNPLFQRVAAEQHRLEQGAAAPLEPRRKPQVAEAGPLGDDPAQSHVDYWNTRDPRFFALRDEVLERELSGIGDFSHFLTQFNDDPRVFSFIARLIELQPNGAAKLHAVQYLGRVLPQQFGTDEAVRHLARLATAAGVELDTVRLTSANGEQRTLAGHPALQRPAGEGDVDPARALAEDVALLDPAHDARDVERLYAVLRLCFDDEVKHELAELVGPLVNARATGRAAVVDLSTFPEAARAEHLAATLGEWRHLGAAAVLSGLTMKVGREELAAQLEAHGYTSAQAREWAGYAARLAQLEGEALTFACADLLPTDERPEPDFTTLPFRLELLAADPTPEVLDDGLEVLDEERFLRVVLGRLAESEPFIAEALADYLESRVAAEALDPELIRELAEPEVLERLEAETVAQLEGAVARLLEAEPAERQGARAALVDCIREGGTFASPGSLARLALGQLYQADLQRVAPLGEVDRELGGVAGQRLPEDPAAQRVDVGGIALSTSQADPEAAPRLTAEEGGLPEGGAARDTLRSLALAMRGAGPVLVEGPSSAEPGALVRHVAFATRAAYLEVDLSQVRHPEELSGPQGAALLTRAARDGAFVHLTHAEKASRDVLALVDGLFDGKGRLKLPNREPVETSRDFRLIASASASGAASSVALAHFIPVRASGPDAHELKGQLTGLGLSLEPATIDALVATHLQLTDAFATGVIEGSGREVSSEALERVARRVAALAGSGELTEGQRSRREAGEVYGGGLSEAARAGLDRALDVVLGAPVDAPQALEELALGAPTTSAPALVVTDRLQAPLVRALKALSLGEPVALAGPASSGKSSLAQECARLLRREAQTVDLDGPGAAEALERAAAAGALIVASGLEGAGPDALERLAALSGGRGHLLVETCAGPEALVTLEGAPPMTVVRVPPLQGSEDVAVVAASVGRRWKVPEAVCQTVATLFEELQGAPLSPTLPQLFGALQLIGENQGEVGLETAYLDAVQLCLASRGRKAEVVARARKLAE